MLSAYKILRQDGCYLKPMFHASPDQVYLSTNFYWQVSHLGPLFVFESRYGANTFLDKFGSTLFHRLGEPYWIFEVEVERMVHCGMALSPADLSKHARILEFWKYFDWSNGSYVHDKLRTYATPLGTSVTNALRLIQPLAIFEFQPRDVQPSDLEKICWTTKEKTDATAKL